jgi:hypothetical protein
MKSGDFKKLISYENEEEKKTKNSLYENEKLGIFAKKT